MSVKRFPRYFLHYHSFHPGNAAMPRRDEPNAGLNINPGRFFLKMLIRQMKLEFIIDVNFQIYYINNMN